MVVVRGWSPFIIASVLIFVTGLPAMAKYLNFPALSMPMPLLHRAVLKMPPVAPQPTPEDAIVNLNFVAIPGTVVFIAGLLAAVARTTSARAHAGAVQTDAGADGAVDARHHASWWVSPTSPATRGWTRCSASVSLARASLFPFFGTLLGWLGVALTGTDAGSNALFGNLQKVTAIQLGLSPILMGAANSTGGVMGKMIDAQSIVVASTATNQQGQEAAIFKAVFVHSIVLACLVGLIVLAYAYLFPSLIP